MVGRGYGPQAAHPFTEWVFRFHRMIVEVIRLTSTIRVGVRALVRVTCLGWGCIHIVENFG